LLMPQVDIKLVSFKADAKIKVIKEVRSVTSLGLKEVRVGLAVVIRPG